jgi:hypothetical protein
MSALMKYIINEASPNADITLLAVGNAKFLYEKYGFWPYACSWGTSNPIKCLHFELAEPKLNQFKVFF